MKKLISMVLIACLLLPYQPVIADEYRLGPYDTLEISIINHDELKAKQTVTPDGQVSFPLLGFVSVQGNTLKELHQMLTDRYKAYIENPQVVVNLIPRPIYVIQHDLKKNDWDVKTAKSIDEAKAFAGPNQIATIEHGGVYKVNSGKTPDWWEDNWYKVLTATAVVVGIYSTTRKW